MKKIFTLVLAVAFVASANAQYGNDRQEDYGTKRNKDVVFDDDRYKNDNNRYDDHHSNGKWEMEREIAQINREYDQRIQSVKFNFFMNPFRKERMIYRLEDQRRDEIKMVYARSNNRHDQYYERRKRWQW